MSVNSTRGFFRLWAVGSAVFAIVVISLNAPQVISLSHWARFNAEVADLRASLDQAKDKDEQVMLGAIANQLRAASGKNVALLPHLGSATIAFGHQIFARGTAGLTTRNSARNTREVCRRLRTLPETRDVAVISRAARCPMASRVSTHQSLNIGGACCVPA